jgi:hypothetical protein
MKMFKEHESVQEHEKCSESMKTRRNKNKNVK